MNKEKQKVYEKILAKTIQELDEINKEFYKKIIKEVKYLVSDEYNIREEIVEEWLKDYCKKSIRKTTKYLISNYPKNPNIQNVDKWIKECCIVYPNWTQDLRNYIIKKIEIKVSDLEFIDINTLDFYDLEHTIKSNITNLKYECEIIYKKFDKKFNEINWPKFHLQTYEQCLTEAHSCRKEYLNIFLEELPDKFKSIEIYEYILNNNNYNDINKIYLPKEFQEKNSLGKIELTTNPENVLKKYSEKNNDCYKVFLEFVHLNPEKAISSIPKSKINYMVYLVASKYKLSKMFVKQIPEEYQSCALYINILLNNDFSYFDLIPKKYLIEVKLQLENKSMKEKTGKRL